MRKSSVSLYSTISAVALMLAAPAAAQTTFTISWWGFNGDKLQEIVVDPFQEMCGCEVVFETGNNSDRLNRLQMRSGAGVDVIYPGPQVQHTRVEVPLLSDMLCGASRPGHFSGVATVVCKLFNMVQPQVAVFGKKDYQQLLVVRKMVEDLAMPVVIHAVDTMREEDGLAMSSRNAYLTAAERARAPALYAILRRTADEISAGSRDFGGLEQAAAEALQGHGARPDYFQIRRARDLGQPAGDEQEFVLLAAAYLGKARLIDNIELDI